MNILNVHAGI